MEGQEIYSLDNFQPPPLSLSTVIRFQAKRLHGEATFLPHSTQSFFFFPF